MARGPGAQRRLAHQVGADARRPARPTRCRTGTPSPSAAAPGSGSASSAPATATGSSSTATSPARSTCRSSSGARSRAPTSATGSTRPTRVTATCPRRWCCCAAARVRGPAPAPGPDLDHPPQHRQPPRRREARHPRRGHRPALPRDQRRVGGPHPLRDDRSRSGSSGATSCWPTGSTESTEPADVAYFFVILACSAATRSLERRLLERPHLRLELAVDGGRVVVDVGHVVDRGLDAPHQLVRPARGALGHGLRGRRAARRRARTATPAPPARPRRRRGSRRTARWRARSAARRSAAHIHVWPPPGCRPSCRNRVSNRARCAASRTSQHEGQVHAGADGRAVDGGQRRQR